MRIFERTRTRAFLAASALAVVLAPVLGGCDDETRCIRFSDCAVGYTCADTHCVKSDEVPLALPSDVDAADEAPAANADAGAPLVPATDAGARDSANDAPSDGAAADAPTGD